MASGGPKPPSLARYRDISYRALVLAADPEFLTEASRVVEYEMPAKNEGKRIFMAWYKQRHPYGSGP